MSRENVDIVRRSWDASQGFFTFVRRWSEAWGSRGVEDLDIRPEGEDRVIALFRQALEAARQAA